MSAAAAEAAAMFVTYSGKQSLHGAPPHPGVLSAQGYSVKHTAVSKGWPVILALVNLNGKVLSLVR